MKLVLSLLLIYLQEALPKGPPVTISHTRSCEVLTAVPQCTPLGYPNTYTPNPRGHPTQEEASLELEDFQPLLLTNCSLYLRHFLCAYYAPLCQPFLLPGTLVPPCRELCVHVYTLCQPLMAAQGVAWPEHLNCSMFPTKGDTPWCFGPDNTSVLADATPVAMESPLPLLSQAVSTPTSKTVTPSTTGGSKLTSSPAATSQATYTKAPPLMSSPSPTGTHPLSPPTCQPIMATSVCRNMPYINASLPNLKGHNNQEDAENELQQFVLFSDLQCSDMVLPFLCAYYMPECDLGHTLQPCKELCSQVQEDCTATPKTYRVHWPKHLNCDMLPSRDSGEDCNIPEARDLVLSTNPISKTSHKLIQTKVPGNGRGSTSSLRFSTTVLFVLSITATLCRH